jgi:uroporphyrinogen III methyltransferase/synthase
MKPLTGKRIIVTRARAQASELIAMIEDLGGKSIEFPVIEMVPPKDINRLDQAIGQLKIYHWIIFTSVNGVEFFLTRLMELGIDIHDLDGANIAAVGPRTAEALKSHGFNVDLLPDVFNAEGLLDAIADRLKPGQHIFLPRGAGARSILPQKLTELGLKVTAADVYNNVMTTESADQVVRMIRDQEIHYVTFTSSSTVKNFITALQNSEVEDIPAFLQGVNLVCIGPLTAKTAMESGLVTLMLAKEATLTGLVDVIVTHALHNETGVEDGVSNS